MSGDDALRVLVRVDASAAIGYGHAMRCLSLAEALHSAGAGAVLATTAMPPAIADRYRRCGALVTIMDATIGSEADANATIALAQHSRCTWVVVDNYAVAAPWQSLVRNAGLRLLVLDDEASAAGWCADLILNQNASGFDSAYRERAPAAGTLLGPRYALLRSEFTPYRDRPRPIATVARRFLVTMGGADIGNVTSQVLALLRQLDDINVRVIVGGASPHQESIARTVAATTSTTRTATLLVQPSDMPAQMAWADIAVSSGGSTVWELAVMRLPALLVELAPNQRAGIRACVDAGAAEYIGDLAAADVARRIDALRADHGRRAAMAAAGPRLVDGHGAARVVQALERCA